jgi:pimeloyl-ACP methyl ester carboxylesterase
MQSAYQFPERTERVVLTSSGGLGAVVTSILRAAGLPSANFFVGALSTVPARLTPRLLGVRALGDVLRPLTDGHHRRSFQRTARTVLEWRGQTLSASHQLGLLRGVPVLVVWGGIDKTIRARHHRALAERSLTR